ncbi:MAG: C40 family peptidase [Bacteroidales bacterium]|jgi:hypothetical protein|nr:C40 family peptidase [Bacteroidales bacterium]
METQIAVSLQGFIPVRKDPYERSEMVTQVLFGEYFNSTDYEGNWIYIKMHNDGYEGWVDKKCITPVHNIQEHAYIVARENTTIVEEKTGQLTILPIGSSITAVKDGTFSIENNTYRLKNMDNYIVPGSVGPKEILSHVLSVPYLWGGRCGFGFDCSGLVQYLCRFAGKNLPRDASEQSAIGETLSFLNEVKTGDLAFFDNTEGMIQHVGMMINNDRIIHASGSVRIDRIDQQGIYNVQLGEYTHKLRVLKRV